MIALLLATVPDDGLTGMVERHVTLAESRLRRDQSIDRIVKGLRDLEDLYGAGQMFGGDLELADRYDGVLQAWKEQRG